MHGMKVKILQDLLSVLSCIVSCFALHRVVSAASDQHASQVFKTDNLHFQNIM